MQGQRIETVARKEEKSELQKNVYQLADEYFSLLQNFLRLETFLRDESPEDCIKLINALDDATLIHALNVQQGPFLLSLALMRLSSDICIRLIDCVSNENLNKTLTLKSSNGLLVLQHVLAMHAPNLCAKLIDRISDKVLDLAAGFVPDSLTSALQRVTQSTLLRIALGNQPPEICVKLIERISEDVLSSAVDAHLAIGWNLLVAAASRQSESVFVALCKKLFLLTFAEASRTLNDKNESLFEIVFQYQTSNAVKIFLNRLKHPHVKGVINQFFKKNTHNLIGAFTNVSLYQSIENCQFFLSRLDDEVHEILVTWMSSGIHWYHERFALRAFEYKLNQQLENKQESKWEEKNKTSVSKTVKLLLKPLHQYDKQKSSQETKFASDVPLEKNALNLFNRGVFVKIVRADRKKYNDDFITHLFNTAQRHVVRDKTTRDKQGWKMLLSPLQEKKEEEKKLEIVYQGPEGFPVVIKARSKQEWWQHKLKKRQEGRWGVDSTKHAVTYVSPEKHAGLFGYRQDRDMVGYAFTVNPDKIKLLVTRDCGTFKRWWYGKKLNELYGEVGYALKFVCKSFSEFTKRVDQQPYVLNEALVKLNKRDLFAIVIAKDTPLARKIAIERRLELMRVHRVDLPIVFYNPEYQHSAIYTSIEQRHDYPVLFLAELETRIRQRYVAPRKFACLFGAAASVSICVDFENYEISMETAKKILELIKVNEKTPERTFAPIMSLLQPQRMKSAVSSLGRRVLEWTHPHF